MASTYSDRLKLELMETGANANTWGNNTNTNLETLDAFSGGYLSKSVAGSSNVTLTSNNADPTAEASNKVIELTGALTGDIHVFIPAVENNYLVYNNTSGSQSVTIAATGHGANGAVISQGGWHWVYCDGSANFNVTEAEFTTTNASALTEGTLADGRFPATLPNISGANLTNLNASNVASGTLPDARFPATLPSSSGANLTNLNASNVSSGTLASDRLPTVPTTKGGTGLTSVGSAGQFLSVAPGGGLQYTTLSAGGDYIARFYTGPSTWSKPAGLQAVKVTVVGGGGGGGGYWPGSPSTNSNGGGGGGGGAAQEYIDSPSIPGPVSVTVGPGGSGGGFQGNGATGGTSSFGGFLSATGGGGGWWTSAPGTGGRSGAGGSGSGGNINATGQYGHAGKNDPSGNPAAQLAGDSAMGFGQGGRAKQSTQNDRGFGSWNNGSGFGGGGGGGFNPGPISAKPGANGSAGVVIVEEFY